MRLSLIERKVTRAVARAFLAVRTPSSSDMGDAQKLPNQNRHPSYGSRIKSADAHGGREHDACFSSMPGSRPSAPGRRAARTNSRYHDSQNSLVAAKNAGNFAESALFCENLSRKHLRIQ